MSHAKSVARMAAVMVCALAAFPSLIRADANVTVHAAQVINPNAKLLMGNAFDARTNYVISGKAVGYYSPTDGSILPIGQYWLDHLQQTSLRYPMGPVNTWDWKATIGPVASRPPQPLINNQVAKFGLDEFLAMAASQPEMSLQDINMMVNIYRNGNLTAHPQAIQDAKDLVEYLNLPAGQGHPLADQRAANGHPAPYGIQIFNLGNEPWADTEYNFLTTGDANPANDGAKRFASDAQLFIDAMKSVDPSIRITVPVASPRNNPPQQAKVIAWQQYMIDTLGEDVYGFVPNLYYDTQIANQRGVGVMETNLDTLASQITAYNQSHGTSLKIVVGEQAHAIQIDYTTNPPTPLNPEFAMQWRGAVTTADFLMMASSKPMVERSHFFVFGNGKATWHPIRLNDVPAGPGQYTIMPVTDLYEHLGSVVKGKSLLTSTSSPLPGDEEDYSVRSGAFLSDNGSELAIVLVNRDPSAAHLTHVDGVDGFELVSATLLWADSALAESIHADVQSVAPMQVDFNLPALSVLLLSYEPVPEPSALTGAMGLLLLAITRGQKRLLSRATNAPPR